MHRPYAVMSLGVAAMVASAAPPAAPASSHPELGQVRWMDDLDAGQAIAGESGRPVFLLFQEVPGCQGCVDFGAGPLSHPLLVEAIETEMVPVVVFNNRKGKDEAILERYQEPAWNYPVARIVDSSGKDLIPRRDRIFSAHGISQRMIEALNAAERPIPTYLRLVMEETAPDTRSATFAMHCYWEGQAKLGGLEGVVNSRAGWIDNREVVEVQFNPKVLDYGRLVEKAIVLDCANRVYANPDQQLAAARARADEAAVALPGPARDAKPSDQLYALGHHPLRFLPLTPMQANKVNAAIWSKRDPTIWLSPRQLALAGRIAARLESEPDALDGLKRPATVDELPGYERELHRRLTTTP